MSFEEICAILVGEPYYLSLAQIARLTWYQVWQIYFRPRPEAKEREAPPQGQRVFVTPFQLFWIHEHQRGQEDAAIIARWLKDHPERMAEAIVKAEWHAEWKVRGAGPDQPT